MPFVRITNSSVELIGDDFRVLRTIATSASTADRNPRTSSSVIVHTNGSVVLYDDNAKTLRTITSGGVSGIFSGDDIIVRKINGATEVWSQSGQLLRTLDSGINVKNLSSRMGI